MAAKSEKPRCVVEEEFSMVRRGKDSVQSMDTDLFKRPDFPPAPAATYKREVEFRRIPIPANRAKPLEVNWLKIFTPVTEQLKLQIRYNTKTKGIELKTCKFTADSGAIQKGCDFVTAFTLGFDVEDALALLRLDDLFLDTFEVTDVKRLKGDHLSRAIGRVAGSQGKTKFTIENATKTRIVLADSKIHILGSYQNIRIVRTTISNLILGAPSTKVYGKLMARTRDRW